MPKTSTPKTFYRKLPKDIVADAERLRKFFEAYPEGTDVSMREYFGEYWAEFKKFWTSEVLDWISFACVPHNGVWFIQWVFYHHPEVRQQVMADLEAVLKQE